MAMMATERDATTEVARCKSARRARRRAVGGVLCLTIVVWLPTAASGQEFPPGSPESVVRTFYGSFQGRRWEAMANTLHPAALDLLRYRVLAVVRADETSSVARRLYDRDRAGVEALDDVHIVAGLMAGVFAFAPGMMQAMLTKRIAILGHVSEDTDDGTLAHVVLRSREPLSGSAPSRISVVTLARSEGAWRVQWSEELDVVASALVAIPQGSGGSR